MTVKKKNRFTALSSADFAEPEVRDTSKTAMGASPDISALATVLAADYPLIDQPLIMALMSDYEPSSLLAKLPEIREQLGILEASLVPDTDEAYIPETTYSVEEDLIQSTSSLSITKENGNDRRKSPLSGTARTSDSGLGNGKSGTRSTSSPLSETEAEEGEEGYLDELELLGQLFPTVTSQQIREALSVEPSLPSAIDHLLSLELIKDVETRGEWPDEVITDEGKIAPVEEELMPPFNLALARVSSHPPRKTKSKRNKQIIVPLVDTLKRSSPQLSPVPSRSQSPSSASSRTHNHTPPRPSDNAWGTMASLAAHLSDLLSPSASYFLSYLHSPKYFSPYSAVRASLSAIPGSAAVQDDTRSRQVLEEMYGLSLGEGSLQVQNDLELCAKVAGGDVATVMDLMDLLGEISQWAGDDDLDKYDQYSRSATNSPISSSSTLPSVQVMESTDEEDGSAPSIRSKKKTNRMNRRPKALAYDSERDDMYKADLAMHASTDEEGGSALASRPKGNPNRMTRRPKPAAPDPEKDEMYRTELMMRPGTKPTNLLRDRIIPGAKAATTSTMNPTAHDNFGETSSFSQPMGRSQSNPGKQIHPKNWRHVNHVQERQRRNGQLHPYAANIPSYARGALPHDATPGALYSAQSGELTIEECLRRAQAEREKRESSVRLAGKHFKLSGGSRATNGSVTGAYAMRARESADAARVWELKAARMVVMTRLRQTGHTIDLHNLTVQEAQVVVLEAAEWWWEKEKAKFHGFSDGANRKVRSFVPARALTVITGVGRHSAGQTGVLGPAVANTLEANGWRIERGERSRGYISVHARSAF